jgi:hypothetical protein
LNDSRVRSAHAEELDERAHDVPFVLRPSALQCIKLVVHHAAGRRTRKQAKARLTELGVTLP